MTNFFRTTVNGGIFFILPFAVLAIVFAKVMSALRPVSDRVAEIVPFESLIGLKVPVLLTALALLATCFFAGLLGRTRAAESLVGFIESDLLSKIPGYALLKNMGEDIVTPAGQSGHKVVLVRFDEAWQIGFKIEEVHDGKLVAVFIPDSPTPQTGAVLLVSPDRIRSTNIPLMAAFSCLKNRGNGIGKILRSS